MRALRVLRDPRADSWFWVEYRQPGGPVFDASETGQQNAFQGALVHVEGPTLDSLHTHLLRFDGGSGSFDPAALLPGHSWKDPYSPVTLSVVSADSNGLTMSVSYDSPCSSISMLPLIADGNATSVTVGVTAGVSCSWTASTGSSWITPLVTSGSGSQQFSLSLGSNTGNDPRYGYVSVNGQNAEVAQLGQAIAIAPSLPLQLYGPQNVVQSSCLYDSTGESGFEKDSLFLSIGPNCNTLLQYGGSSSSDIWLIGDAGGYTGPVHPGDVGKSVANSFCTILSDGSKVSVSGTTLSLAMNVELKAGIPSIAALTASAASPSYNSVPITTLGYIYPLQTGILSPVTNPIVVSPGATTGTATLQWDSPLYANTELHLLQADGPLFAGGGPLGTATTGNWVSDGMPFYLVQPRTGVVIATTNVAVITANADGSASLKASPSFLTLVPGESLGTTTLVWSAPNSPATELLVGTPNGTLLANGGSTGIATTGDWVSNNLSFFLVDQSTKQVLASTTVYTVPTPPPGQGVLNIVPEPITPAPGLALGQAQLIWNAPGFAQVQIRVGSPQGPVMAGGSSEGIAATGAWVSGGLMFFLVDTNGNTLASATAELASTVSLAATPNPVKAIPGGATGVTTLAWNAPGVAVTEIHVGGSTGPLFTQGGSAGSAATGDWVSDGMIFVLLNSYTGQLLASTTVHVTN